jgi:hypothetical protein
MEAHVNAIVAAERAFILEVVGQAMKEHGELMMAEIDIRIKLNGVEGGCVTERVRGYRRKTNRQPYPPISTQFPGKIDTTTPYVINKVVSRLEMDSRWALARSSSQSWQQVLRCAPQEAQSPRADPLLLGFVDQPQPRRSSDAAGVPVYSSYGRAICDHTMWRCRPVTGCQCCPRRTIVWRAI